MPIGPRGGRPVGEPGQVGRFGPPPARTESGLRSSGAARPPGVPVLDIGPRTDLVSLISALERVPSNRFMLAETRRVQNPPSSLLTVGRYEPPTVTTIYSSTIPPTESQRRTLRDAILATAGRQIGTALRSYSPMRSNDEIELLRRNLRLDDVSQEAVQIRLIVRLAEALPVLKAWGSLSDQLVLEGSGPSAAFRWATPSERVGTAAIERAKSAVLAIAEDACRAHAGEAPLTARELLPARAMKWFDTRGAALTAGVVRELGRHAEYVMGQYKSLPVEGPETIRDLLDFMQTLGSETYICARRDRSDRLVLKTQLHQPTRRESERAAEWICYALDRCATADPPLGPVDRDIGSACWKIYDQERQGGGITSRFLSGVIDQLRRNPAVTLPAPPYYGEGHHDPEMRVPRMPIPRDARYPNILTKMRAFEGEEFETPTEPAVLKLTADELEQCRAVVRNGGLETIDGVPINNETMKHAMRSGKYLVYVTDINGDMYVGADKTIQHSSFLYQVADAGQISFDDATGECTLNPWSGHMTPDEPNTRQTEDCLRSQGMNNLNVVVIPWG